MTLHTQEGGAHIENGTQAAPSSSIADNPGYLCISVAATIVATLIGINIWAFYCLISNWK